MLSERLVFRLGAVPVTGDVRVSVFELPPLLEARKQRANHSADARLPFDRAECGPYGRGGAAGGWDAGPAGSGGGGCGGGRNNFCSWNYRYISKPTQTESLGAKAAAEAVTNRTRTTSQIDQMAEDIKIK